MGEWVREGRTNRKRRQGGGGGEKKMGWGGNVFNLSTLSFPCFCELSHNKLMVSYVVVEDTL